ncbi:iron-containing alcohol dehydrogenase [Microbacterium proteolyticum]|uniref:iron-containing alcohol dehydrogenase n=1 Tax=Microbacterium proteolyticum TaxID=1572644 RepID=UPI001FAE6EE4|nr:iron-containing alcohol dehydrogenase [Microbacterium proteolyticum]MCI9857586.1 iron-containing alcohol dehydrogenase [Microbacterium proteolyticum]
MSAIVHRRRSTLVAGFSVARSVCAAATAGRRTAVVVDARLAHLADVVAHPAVVVALDTARVDASAVDAVAARLRDARVETVVAVGGGTTIDTAAVAAVGVASPRTLTWALDRSARVAVVPLPPPDVAAVDVIAVPTTLGTSAETNSVAIVRTDHGQRLIVGEGLRPRYAVLDADHYITLPGVQARTGCLEAILRLAGASTAERAHPRAHAHAVAIGRALVGLGDGSLSPAARLMIARWSAATQRTAALRGRVSFSPRHWYLANEVSFVARTTKMRATASIVAGVWRCIEDGDSRWGSPRPLEAFWREVVRGTRLPIAPSAGIDALVARWALPLATRPDPDALTSMAVRVERWWGGRTPALPGITASDVRSVLEGARWAPTSARADASRLAPETIPMRSRGGDHT